MSFGLSGRGAGGRQGALQLQQCMPGTPKGQHSKQQLGFRRTSPEPDVTCGYHLSALSSSLSREVTPKACSIFFCTVRPFSFSTRLRSPREPNSSVTALLSRGGLRPSGQYHSGQQKSGADRRREINGLLRPTNH